MKVILHEPLEKWISKAQQGFLTGRSMNSNIIRMDFLSKIFALTEPQAALVFFDFKAAFPSVLQSFMWEALRHIGLSEGWIALLQLFYSGNRQQIGADPEASFLAEVGIRQGCQLSPLLFAASAELLLRILKKRLRLAGETRTFADGTAVAVNHIEDHQSISSL